MVHDRCIFGPVPSDTVQVPVRPVDQLRDSCLPPSPVNSSRRDSYKTSYSQLNTTQTKRQRDVCHRSDLWTKSRIYHENMNELYISQIIKLRKVTTVGTRHLQCLSITLWGWRTKDRKRRRVPGQSRPSQSDSRPRRDRWRWKPV